MNALRPALVLIVLASAPALADPVLPRLDRIEDRIDRRESVIDRRNDHGRRDVIEDRFDRVESRLDRRTHIATPRFDRHERRSWARTWPRS